MRSRPWSTGTLKLYYQIIIIVFKILQATVQDESINEHRCSKLFQILKIYLNFTIVPKNFFTAHIFLSSQKIFQRLTIAMVSRFRRLKAYKKVKLERFADLLKNLSSKKIWSKSFRIYAFVLTVELKSIILSLHAKLQVRLERHISQMSAHQES